MTTSDIYFKALITSLAVLISAVVILLYGSLENTKVTKQSTSSVEQAPPLQTIQYQKLQKTLIVLNNIIDEQKNQTARLRNVHERQVDLFIIKISDLQLQLEKTQLEITQLNGELKSSTNFTLQLTQQLQQVQQQRSHDETSLVSASMQVEVLNENLAIEKQRLRALHTTSNQNSLAMLKMENQLVQNKSSLVRNKRALAISNQALRLKSRELTITQGQVDDMNRKNQQLNQKIVILDE